MQTWKQDNYYLPERVKGRGRLRLVVTFRLQGVPVQTGTITIPSLKTWLAPFLKAASTFFLTSFLKFFATHSKTFYDLLLHQKGLSLSLSSVSCCFVLVNDRKNYFFTLQALHENGKKLRSWQKSIIIIMITKFCFISCVTFSFLAHIVLLRALYFYIFLEMKNFQVFKAYSA